MRRSCEIMGGGLDELVPGIGEKGGRGSESGSRVCVGRGRMRARDEADAPPLRLSAAPQSASAAAAPPAATHIGFAQSSKVMVMRRTTQAGPKESNESRPPPGLLSK